MEAARYRPATYLHKQKGALTFFRAPVYVKTMDRKENIIEIPAGTVYEETNALFFAEWNDGQWLQAGEETGKRLNSPLQISVHPHFMGGAVPSEEFELLPSGSFGNAYLRAGVR
jgi:hypothetical protein